MYILIVYKSTHRVYTRISLRLSAQPLLVYMLRSYLVPTARPTNSAGPPECSESEYKRSTATRETPHFKWQGQ